ncbi:MAG: hypothetical protein JWN14_5121 [Chthonomonadales bacterium]|nr:hypothetical protein [Chthonomonadales bacterium]
MPFANLFVNLLNRLHPCRLHNTEPLQKGNVHERKLAGMAHIAW